MVNLYGREMVRVAGLCTKEEVILLQKDKSIIVVDFYKCPRCGTDTNLVKWNKSKRPYPKCDGKRIYVEN